MNSTIYFISDVHLGYGDPKADKIREKRLLQVLDQIEREARAGNIGALFIVGDLFDSWFEFYSVVPRRHVKTLASLGRIAEFTRVEYLMGNHDFGHRDFFASELNIQVHGGDIERVLLGKRCYIAHGDGKAANDWGYVILRKILRSKLARALYWTIHPDLGIPFAEYLSRSSRAYTDNRGALKKHDGLKDFAEKKIATGAYDFVVMGHRHHPQIEQFEKGCYINLGDWISSYTYGILDQDGFRILKAPEFQPLGAGPFNRVT